MVRLLYNPLLSVYSLICKSVQKWEFEVYQKIDGKWKHIGIMRPCGPDKGKILTEFAKGVIKK